MQVLEGLDAEQVAEEAELLALQPLVVRALAAHRHPDDA
jgi:hypothetical protein